MLDNTPNHPSKFRSKNWIEVNDDARGTYNTNSQIKFKTSVLKWSLYDYSGAYTLAIGTIKIDGEGAHDNAKQLDEINKGALFKNCAPVTDCISEISNIQINNAKDLDLVNPMYNLIEYSNKYSRTSGSLWQ